MDGQPQRPVLGEGPPDPIGILVGEGPGRDEEEQGRPFVGVTGQQLDTELMALGLRRSRLFILNATCCRPPPGKTERLMQKATTCCRPAFLEQLKAFPLGTPMFAMGKWAAFAVLGKKTKAIMKTRGFIRDVPVPKVINTWEEKIWRESPPESLPPSEKKQRRDERTQKPKSKKR